ncbi:methyltransferase, partial [Paenibacillus riograndensis]
MDFNLHMESIIKLLVAMLFGLFIGIDRQLKQKPLGIRTSMVISIASCLVTLVSIHAYDKFGGPDHPNMDPMRLACLLFASTNPRDSGASLVPASLVT